jgi:hypothetical protein
LKDILVGRYECGRRSSKKISTQILASLIQEEVTYRPWAEEGLGGEILEGIDL